MASLPADVEQRYRRLAARRGWSTETETAFRAAVTWYRTLDETPGPRSCFEYVDDGLADPGARCLWETVTADHETVAVKQIDISSTGTAHRYWWQNLDDDSGTLTDQPLGLDQPGLTRIPDSAFYALWHTIRDPAASPEE
ncbi:hypothetical protein ACFORO_28075 [Amycolatopsis halotolerans]|uniref:Uncharacterized protein n=1 Tax=Amycolatopsis halotolerans TaxID=330083 RepID=A0ABV7QNY2_9PSEU